MCISFPYGNRFFFQNSRIDYLLGFCMQKNVSNIGSQIFFSYCNRKHSNDFLCCSMIRKMWVAENLECYCVVAHLYSATIYMHNDMALWAKRKKQSGNRIAHCYRNYQRQDIYTVLLNWVEQHIFLLKSTVKIIISVKPFSC